MVQQDVPITKEWVATLTGLVNADIRAQVNGYLIRQNYPNGAFVRKGAQLFPDRSKALSSSVGSGQSKPRTTKGTLEQAKATLEEAKADQQRAEAALGKTEIDVARYTPLAKESVISQQELDNAIQANLAAKAQVAAMKAAVGNARATIVTDTAAIGAAGQRWTRTIESRFHQDCFPDRWRGRYCESPGGRPGGSAGSHSSGNHLNNESHLGAVRPK